MPDRHSNRRGNDSRYVVSLERNGLWPTRWWWYVRDKETWHSRAGFAFTKDRARRKTVAARLSMERDDVEVQL